MIDIDTTKFGRDRATLFSPIVQNGLYSRYHEYVFFEKMADGCWLFSHLAYFGTVFRCDSMPSVNNSDTDHHWRIAMPGSINPTGKVAHCEIYILRTLRSCLYFNK